MKTAKEWFDEIDSCRDSKAEFAPICVEKIAEIQADALRYAADIANKHRQELFEDGLEVDLDEMDKKSIFLESMTQERDAIEDAIRSEADSLTQRTTP